MRPSVLFAVLASLALSGCTENHSTIWIARLAAPEAGDGDGTRCAASDTTMVSSSVTPGSAYSTFLVVSNGVRNNARDLSNDTGGVILEGIEVTLSDAGGNPVGGAFTVPVGGMVPSADSPTDPGQFTTFAQILPASVTAGLAVDTVVIASAQVYGHTLGGHEVESAFFSWPISVVAPSGCTVCSDDASGIDLCTPGQDGACTVVECM